MSIPENVIRQIQEAADVVEVIQDYLSLKKKGKDYVALCPFHHEKTPSFTVSPAKQIYKCFGCGKGGDAISFVMEIEGISFVEAVRRLAERYKIPLPEEAEHTSKEALEAAEEASRRKESILIALQFAQQTYSRFLWETEEGQAVGLSYFKQRGLREATIRKFELGYAPDTWDAFTQAALKAGYQADILQAADLTYCSDKTQNLYDRFRNRAIFPIHNSSGKVIAFAGRTFSTDKKVAKYINSADTPVYDKSKVLYGLHLAKQSIRQQDKCYIVEGYMDVMSLHQAGIENVVATSGTSLTVEQVRLLRRFTENITILYDGDEAGIKAALRGIDLLLEENVNVRLVLMPPGEDPDSYLLKVGASAFVDYLSQKEEDFLHFKARHLLPPGTADPLAKAQAIRELAASIARMGDRLKRRMYIRQLSQDLNVEEEWVIDEVNTILFREKRGLPLQREAAKEVPEVSDSVVSPLTSAFIDMAQYRQERDLLFLLLSFAGEQLEDERFFAEYILEEISDITIEHEPFKSMLAEFCHALEKGEILSLDYFLHHPQEAFKQAVIDMLTALGEPSAGWERYEIFIKKPEDTFTDNAYKNILRLKHRFLKKKEKKLLDAMKEAAKANDMEQQMLLLKQMQENKALLSRLSDILKNVTG
ncbi:DNA primase [Thermonema lapsum]|uniref:DNA primase n=1 Tax=Thermonema lapsum TaxID=28195 RepID=A0A846MM18_9BACT|nr:DNA primase [Thermonema lapsum]NIK72576.1 DNA primase [Thermonema lapsum]